jgi:hypothetical protein
LASGVLFSGRCHRAAVPALANGDVTAANDLAALPLTASAQVAQFARRSSGDWFLHRKQSKERLLLRSVEAATIAKVLAIECGGVYRAQAGPSIGSGPACSVYTGASPEPARLRHRQDRRRLYAGLPQAGGMRWLSVPVWPSRAYIARTPLSSDNVQLSELSGLLTRQIGRGRLNPHSIPNPHK